jgi:hypothetical protein
MAVTTATLASSRFAISVIYHLSHRLTHVSILSSMLRIMRKAVEIILTLRVLSNYPSWLVSKMTYF